MKKILFSLPFLAILASCSKKDTTPNNNNATSASETGYLLSKIVETDRDGIDTTYFTYNDKNQLTKYQFSGGMVDSIVYNTAGQIVSYSEHSILAGGYLYRVGLNYSTDKVVKTETYYPSGIVYTSEFILSGNRIVKNNFPSNAPTSSSSYSTYDYNGSGSIAREIYFDSYDNSRDTTTYNYANQIFNPYQTLGTHVWSFIENDPMSGETNFLFTSMTKSNIVSTMSALMATENAKLPKKLYSGAWSAEFFYVKKK